MGVIFELREVHIPSMDHQVDYADGLSDFIASYLFYKMIALKEDMSERELLTFVHDTNYLNIERFIGKSPDPAMLDSMDELMDDIDYFVPNGLLSTMPHVLTTHPFRWQDHELSYATYDNPRRDRTEDLIDMEADVRVMENFWEEGEYYSPPAQRNRYNHISERYAESVNLKDLLR